MKTLTTSLLLVMALASGAAFAGGTAAQESQANTMPPIPMDTPQN